MLFEHNEVEAYAWCNRAYLLQYAKHVSSTPFIIDVCRARVRECMWVCVIAGDSLRDDAGFGMDVLD